MAECESTIRDFLHELEVFINYKRSEKMLSHVAWHHGYLEGKPKIYEAEELAAERAREMARLSWGRLEKIMAEFLSCRCEEVR